MTIRTHSRANNVDGKTYMSVRAQKKKKKDREVENRTKLLDKIKITAKKIEAEKQTKKYGVGLATVNVLNEFFDEESNKKEELDLKTKLEALRRDLRKKTFKNSEINTDEIVGIDKFYETLISPVFNKDYYLFTKTKIENFHSYIAKQNEELANIKKLSGKV